ncbi:zinc ribbon domain-containing protein [Paucibacter sp. DJ1R-11]|uniref:FmdB family zinc ribbon protein n=1 Tax=Paucibacter sp. DJ1R-11 TaxID=2893556 RepID=UPI0021E39BA4|nr:FmdB family zinc ribbon protein [Paucibacter sp. DJ1R-11]MCV2365091.1 zinc ribbon domain-containing protein [Paucibacter sp. DJ1R-11]
MPIYAYRCAECGHAKDVLQKMSDAPLSTCPHCGAEAFQKQVTAAGFQLKGSGWYATDFKGGGSVAAATGATGGVVAGAPSANSASESGGGSSSGESGSSSASAPAACGGSCACH